MATKTIKEYMRKLMIKLRAFYVLYIKGHRCKLSKFEADRLHFQGVIKSVPALKKAILLKKLDNIHKKILKRKKRKND